MRYTADLHAHSHYSDSLCSPKELVKKEHEMGIDLLALTDHDTTEGIAEAEEEAKKYGIRVIPGIEFATKENDMLGLFIDRENPQLKSFMTEAWKKHNEVNIETIARLNDMGYDITIEELSKTGRGTILNGHLAHVLHNQKGYFKDYKECFNTLFPVGKPCYINRGVIDPFEAIDLAHAAGGLAIITHPRYSGLGMDALKKLKDHGADGIEVYHKSAKWYHRYRYRRFAKKHGLYISLGSDYHGLYYPRYRSLNIRKELAWAYDVARDRGIIT